MTSAKQILTTSPEPAARRSATGGVVDAALYVFGGVNGSGHHFSDIWRLDLCERVWTRLSDKLPPIRLPGVSHIGDTFYLFGGRGGDEVFFDDTWAMDRDGLRLLDIENPAPAPRYGHSQVAANEQVYIFGGLQKRNGGHKLFCDLWRFDPSSGEWTQISDGTAGPSARYGAAMVAHNDELLLFGGRYLAEEWWYSNETWLFDLQSEKWNLIETETVPAPRYTAGVATTDDAIHIFGGMQSRYEPHDTPSIRLVNRLLSSLPVRNSIFPTFKPNIFFNDLWRFDITERSWRQTASDVGIPPLKTPLMGVHDSSLILGFGNNLRNHYQTVWQCPIPGLT